MRVKASFIWIALYLLLFEIASGEYLLLFHIILDAHGVSLGKIFYKYFAFLNIIRTTIYSAGFQVSRNKDSTPLGFTSLLRHILRHNDTPRTSRIFAFGKHAIATATTVIFGTLSRKAL